MNLKCSTEDFTCGSSEEHTKATANSQSLSTDKVDIFDFAKECGARGYRENIRMVFLLQEPTSQPGTPASVASLRSSDDSYSSSGSSRRLLSSHEKPTVV